MILHQQVTRGIFLSLPHQVPFNTSSITPQISGTPQTTSFHAGGPARGSGVLIGTVGAAPQAMSARPQRCRRGSGWRGAAVSPLRTVKCRFISPSPCAAKGSATSRQDRRRERRFRQSIPSPTTPLLPPALSLSPKFRPFPGCKKKG